jgi:hypothetical protein
MAAYACPPMPLAVFRNAGWDRLSPSLCQPGWRLAVRAGDLPGRMRVAEPCGEQGVGALVQLPPGRAAAFLGAPARTGARCGFSLTGLIPSRSRRSATNRGGFTF